MTYVNQVSFDAGSDGGGMPAMSDGGSNRSRLLIVVEQRALVRGFLGAWIADLDRDAEVISIPDAEAALPPDVLARATMVIIGVRAGALSDAWLGCQVAWLRANRADVPVVAITESDDAQMVRGGFGHLSLQGCIPTSSSMEVAAAAVRLVAAGGIYLPPNRREDHLPEQASLGSMRQSSPSLIARLTPRERAVLELLEQGMANKVIAYRLGMSQSTVKAHVHSIISKLNVRNRTEAAVTAYRPVRVT